ncbi:GAF domain-containing SpoIIE family protein phosphatase [Streptomyces sp. Isolate_45]|uniref:PP2C family protein-serine/threonine phosphatase n=1 Tax=Streptomyces sp. Isolate_45 TaxID=2950111 RepID=UPI002482083A|nr:GAF domain-containing SpoIIE family protein phosphatase [Streptomyces sp. Isolate_45]MDA5283721.1 SpoIIE family protein phosphatase [Streptomyces sp. Isolate_45]
MGRRLDSEMDAIVDRLRELSRTQGRFQDLLEAVMAVGRELELPVVLRSIITAAMDLVDARYGALGVLGEEGEELAEFIPAGLSERELADLADVDLPHGHGLLGHLIRHPEPLRTASIPTHPDSTGFPPGHPPMQNLLGVAITARGMVYGNLYLSERRDGKPFDIHDEEIVVALAGAAGLAIENARLYTQVRANAEHFQRLLLPRLPDLSPFSVAAVYRPASKPDQVGGDWYDALLLPDGTCAFAIGDVLGHGLQAAAAMSQTRNMLRALLYESWTLPSGVLARLDRTLDAITDNPVTTACLARIEPAATGWALRWSTAGHPPPLLVDKDGQAEYLDGEPGIPLGVNADLPRPDHARLLPGGATLILFTDGLFEHPDDAIDTGLDAVAKTAAACSHLPLQDLCRALADQQPSDGRDDLAVLAVRTPLIPFEGTYSRPHGEITGSGSARTGPGLRTTVGSRPIRPTSSQVRPLWDR